MYQMSNQCVDLLPQFGNGCRLPQAALTSRPYRVKRLRNNPILADECSVKGDIQAEQKRIGPRPTPGEQSRHERILQAAVIALRPSAVDHAIDLYWGGFATLALTVSDCGPILVFYVVRDPPGANLKLSAGNLVRNGLGNLRSRAMTMHFPVGSQMTQKATLLIFGKGLPDLSHQRSQAVESALPFDALLLSLPYLFAYQD